MKEYKMAKGWAIFIYIFAPVLIGVFAMPILMYFIPSWRNGETAQFFAFAIPISLIMMGVMVAAVVDAATGELTINEEDIRIKHVFLKRQLQVSDIKGFRIDDKYTYLEPKTKVHKRIKISHYFAKKEEWTGWIVDHFPDLDYEEAEESFQEVLQDNKFGFTEQERLEQFDKVKRVTTILNWAGGIAAAWAFFWPQPYEIAILAVAIIPLLALVALKLYRGLIRIDEKKNSAFPSVFAALFFPAIVLMLRTLIDYNIFEHKQVWILVGPIAIGLTALMLIGQSEFDWQKRRDIFSALVLVLLAFVYAYGLVLSTNCTFDYRSAASFESQILNKSISRSKTTSYYLELAPWGPQPNVDKAEVDRETYEQLEVGDTVEVLFLKGRWGIPWYVVRPG